MAKLSQIEQEQIARVVLPATQAPKLRRLSNREYVDFVSQASRLLPVRKRKPMVGEHWKL